MPGSGPFALQPAIALEHDGLAALEDEVDGDVAVGGAEAHGKAVGHLALRRPVLDPDAEGPRAGAREPEGLAAQPARRVEAPARRVGQGEVREVELARRPRGCARRPDAPRSGGASAVRKNVS